PIDPPTIQMQFAVNDGPLAGQEGKLVTARHIRERLIKEIRTNVALRVADTDAPNIFEVSGRGEMQIAILVEQMRREGYEVLASRPEVMFHKEEDGEATSYALNMVQERGRLMVEPGEKIYKGMIVGENARENDIPVNPCKGKKLTNMRSQGDGKGIQLDAALKLSLERALEYIGSDEYVEATPKSLRLRKKILDENARKRAAQSRTQKVLAA